MSKPAAKKAAPAKVVDRHALVEGARWHYPKPGEPTACAIEGCDRVLRDPRLRNDFDLIEAADEDET